MKKLIRTFTIAAVAAVTIMSVNTGSAAAETLEYTVLRDGTPIGSHAYSITGKGADKTVKVSTDIIVKVLFIVGYKFEHASSETWRGGKLVAIQSTTDDDGTPKKLTARAKGGKLVLNSTVKKLDRKQFAPLNALPASLWNADIVTQDSLINTTDGTIMAISVKDMGADKVKVGSQQVKANHYAIRGELTRDLWFDAKGRLLRVAFPAQDNSNIVYALK